MIALVHANAEPMTLSVRMVSHQHPVTAHI